MADNETNIILKAIDKASAVFDGVNKSIKKINDSSLGQITKELTGFNLSSLGAAGAVTAVAAQVKKAVNETVQYATTIRDTSRLLGISAEDTSRLVQASDDLFISEEALNTALLAASRQGIDVSIKGIKELSKQYLALAPGAERAQFLMQRFGRSGSDMGKLLEVGADGIDAATSAIEKNLVMTDESIRQIEDYKRGLDNLNDSWQGIKYTVGVDVISGLTPLLKLISDLTSGSKNLGVAIDEFVNIEFGGWGFESAVHKAADAVRDYENANNLATMSTIDLINAMSWVSPEAKAAALAEAELLKQTQEAGAAARDTAGYFGELTTKLIFNQAAQGLDSAAALQLARDMGLLNDSTYGASQATEDVKAQFAAGAITAEEYRKKIREIAEAYGAIPTDVYTTVHTSYETADTEGGYGGHNPRVMAGHANGGSWTIPMSYGYEGYRMPGGQTASGGEVITVTPKGKESSNQIILTDEQLKKIGEASGRATALQLAQLGVLR